jgi:hypothetical protein
MVKLLWIYAEMDYFVKFARVEITKSLGRNKVQWEDIQC